MKVNGIIALGPLRISAYMSQFDPSWERATEEAAVLEDKRKRLLAAEFEAGTITVTGWASEDGDREVLEQYEAENVLQPFTALPEAGQSLGLLAEVDVRRVKWIDEPNRFRKFEMELVASEIRVADVFYSSYGGKIVDSTRLGTKLNLGQVGPGQEWVSHLHVTKQPGVVPATTLTPVFQTSVLADPWDALPLVTPDPITEPSGERFRIDGDQQVVSDPFHALNLTVAGAGAAFYVLSAGYIMNKIGG